MLFVGDGHIGPYGPATAYSDQYWESFRETLGDENLQRLKQADRRGIADFLKEAGVGYYLLSARGNACPDVGVTKLEVERYFTLFAWQLEGKIDGYLQDFLNVQGSVTVSPNPAAAGSWVGDVGYPGGAAALNAAVSFGSAGAMAAGGQGKPPGGSGPARRAAWLTGANEGGAGPAAQGGGREDRRADRSRATATAPWLTTRTRAGWDRPPPAAMENRRAVRSRGPAILRWSAARTRKRRNPRQPAAVARNRRAAVRGRRSHATRVTLAGTLAQSARRARRSAAPASTATRWLGLGRRTRRTPAADSIVCGDDDDEQKQRAEREAWLDGVQAILDLVGTFDPTPISDLANAVISAARGRWFDAGCSFVSALPYLGDMAKALKYGRKTVGLASKRTLRGQNRDRGRGGGQHEKKAVVLTLARGAYSQRGSRSDFAGAIRLDGLRGATHADFVNAFRGTGYTPSGHFISRLKDQRAQDLESNIQGPRGDVPSPSVIRGRGWGTRNRPQRYGHRCRRVNWAANHTSPLVVLMKHIRPYPGDTADWQSNADQRLAVTAKVSLTDHPEVDVGWVESPIRHRPRGSSAWDVARTFEHLCS